MRQLNELTRKKSHPHNGLRCITKVEWNSNFSDYILQKYLHKIHIHIICHLMSLNTLYVTYTAYAAPGLWNG